MACMATAWVRPRLNLPFRITLNKSECRCPSGKRSHPILMGLYLTLLSHKFNISLSSLNLNHVGLIIEKKKLKREKNGWKVAMKKEKNKKKTSHLLFIRCSLICVFVFSRYLKLVNSHWLSYSSHHEIEF